MMIKLNKNQVLKAVKTTTKTLLYQLKPEVKKWLLITTKNPTIINPPMKMRKTIGFINALYTL